MKLLTIDEVAQVLRVRRARAYELARLGILPVTRLGRQLRVDQDALATWVHNGGRPLGAGWRHGSLSIGVAAHGNEIAPVRKAQ